MTIRRPQVGRYGSLRAVSAPVAAPVSTGGRYQLGDMVLVVQGDDRGRAGIVVAALGGAIVFQTASGQMILAPASRLALVSRHWRSMPR